MGVLPLRKDNQELKAAVDRALSEGPLTITRDGVPAAVLVPAEEYQRMAQRLAGAERPTLGQLILRRAPEDAVDLDALIGPRNGVWRREAPDFE
ncbi:type II toxin-antitoxin system prevent-host-death family antitoxin [Azospirillum sp.]|uniref:type II toxin-antitoxin system Phd/YefM family antitoxin n=1 Tax=Azospirillum sp. TaxID=34012 RepID=UPI002D2BBF3E|nr:type II toxin-antitoxin system prevent-host-death family antitoxin [Azospirillum sp.]HYD70307.1 type II toxin-antitoxin system prevent-host-death family antitoxin [Azospirillum sp.]